jgi:orotidine-5'-phosphate decarboxylase
MSTIYTKSVMNQMLRKDSLLCVGLDPDLRKIPLSFCRSNEGETVLHFLKSVVDVTLDHCCSYKVQKAFFDIISDGHNVLIDLIKYIKKCDPSFPVMLDCKIGDIDNTMSVYFQNVFEHIGADAVVLNPYMGDEVFELLQNYPDKTGVVLVRTSNPGSLIVQDQVLANGNPLWLEILELMLARWSNYGNLMPILSSTVEDKFYPEARKMIPDQLPILLAGFGAQGGQTSILRDLLNSEGIGVLINSSRGVLFPNGINSTLSDIQLATISTKLQINQGR